MDRAPNVELTTAAPVVLLGEPVIIRTVTNYYTGRLTDMDHQWITLDEAAWIADTGRWHQALGTGVLSEVEPYPDGPVFVAVGAVVVVGAAVVVGSFGRCPRGRSCQAGIPGQHEP